MGGESQEGPAVGNGHLRTGSLVRIRLLAKARDWVPVILNFTDIGLTPSSRDEMKGVGSQVSRMGALSLSRCPFD